MSYVSQAKESALDDAGDPRPLVSVLIVTRGKLPMLKNCLSSMKAGLEWTDSEVVVVEHETADAGQFVHDKYPGYKIFRLTDEETKQSFSTLNNFAAKQSTGKYLWLVNNDVLVRKDTLAEMMKVMDEKPDVGLVGAKRITVARGRHIAQRTFEKGAA